MMTRCSIRALILILATSAIPLFGVTRVVAITAPAAVKPGAAIQIAISASTDAPDAEQIAFFHAEYSVDNGATWNTSYAENLGRTTTRVIDFQAGADGSKALVRVRIAFRGGKAGDVDFSGTPIAWSESWGTWESPPAKHATIKVTSR
jgi:hypothetical protein